MARNFSFQHKETKRPGQHMAGAALYYQLAKFAFLPLALSNRYLELLLQFWYNCDYLMPLILSGCKIPLTLSTPCRKNLNTLAMREPAPPNPWLAFKHQVRKSKFCVQRIILKLGKNMYEMTLPRGRKIEEKSKFI